MEPICKRTNLQLDPVLIGNRIKKALKAAGMQQKELAVTMGVRTATVSRWVTGKAEPSSPSLHGMAYVLNVSVEYLMGLDDKMTSEFGCNLANVSTDDLFKELRRRVL